MLTIPDEHRPETKISSSVVSENFNRPSTDPVQEQTTQAFQVFFETKPTQFKQAPGDDTELPSISMSNHFMNGRLSALSNSGPEANFTDNDGQISPLGLSEGTDSYLV
jgi:hypothetical protein